MGGIVRVTDGLEFSGRMSEDYRLLVAFALSFGLDTILAYLSRGVSAFFQCCLPSRKLQGVPLHI